MKSISAKTSKYVSLLLLVVVLFTMSGAWIGLSSDAKTQMDYYSTGTSDIVDGALGGLLGGYFDSDDYSFAPIKKITKALKDYQLSLGEEASVFRSIIKLDKVARAIDYSDYYEGLGWKYKLANILFNLIYYVTMLSILASLVLRLLNRKDYIAVPTTGICLMFVANIAGVIYVNHALATEINLLSMRAWPFITIILLIASIVFQSNYLKNTAPAATGAGGSLFSGGLTKKKGWDCPSCGTKCGDSTMFCSGCGAKKPDPRSCASCGTPLESNAVFCPKCGCRYGEVTYCEFCGNKLIGNEKCTCSSTVGSSMGQGNNSYL